MAYRVPNRYKFACTNGWYLYVVLVEKRLDPINDGTSVSHAKYRCRSAG